LDPSPYVGTLSAVRSGSFNLGIVAPGSDATLRQVIFRGLSVTTGDKISVTIRPRSTPAVTLQRNGNTVPSSEEQVIPDILPKIFGNVQNADPSVDRFGRVVGVLFSEDVDRTTAENAASYAISSASIPMVPPPALADQNQ